MKITLADLNSKIFYGTNFCIFSKKTTNSAKLILQYCVHTHTHTPDVAACCVVYPGKCQSNEIYALSLNIIWRQT